MPQRGGRRCARRARSAGWPCIRSSPARRRLSPRRSDAGGEARRGRRRRCTNSCGITVSSPAGIMAPVMMLHALRRRPTRPRQAAPASAVPTTRSSSVSLGAARSAPREGVAVHRRVVVRRHADGRDDVLGQHAAERVDAARRCSARVTTAGATSRARKACTRVDAAAPSGRSRPARRRSRAMRLHRSHAFERVQLGQRVGVEEGVGRRRRAVEGHEHACGAARSRRRSCGRRRG